MCDACEKALGTFKPEAIAAMRASKAEMLTHAVALRDKVDPVSGLAAKLLQFMPEELRTHASDFSAIIFATRVIGYIAADLALNEDEIRRVESALQTGLVAGWASGCVMNEAETADKH